MRIFQQYVDRRPPEMCQDNSPFYLSINHKYKPVSYWFKKVPLGIHTIDGMMKKLAKDGNLTGKKKQPFHQEDTGSDTVCRWCFRLCSDAAFWPQECSELEPLQETIS